MDRVLGFHESGGVLFTGGHCGDHRLADSEVIERMNDYRIDRGARVRKHRLPYGAGPFVEIDDIVKYYNVKNIWIDGGGRIAVQNNGRYRWFKMSQRYRGYIESGTTATPGFGAEKRRWGAQ